MIDISKLAKGDTTLQYFSKGQIIFEDGDPSNDKMYIICEGFADIYKNYGKQGEVCIATLTSGAFFGEMSLFLNVERTATIVAKDDISVYVIDRASSLKFLKDQPEIAFSVIQTLCTRLMNTNTNVAASHVKHEQDITAFSHEKTQLEATANTDALTGIYNRRFFMDNAAIMIDAASRTKRVSFIAMFDLDHFKKINDTYGHLAGDQVLASVAEIISGTVRHTDLFARYGGEEFILLISCAQKSDAKMVIERIREKICEKPIEFGDIKIPVSSSIGIALVPSVNSVKDAIELADQSLYRAKKEGRNRTVFSEESNFSEESGESYV